MTCMRFGQIRPPTAELTVFARLQRCCPIFSAVLDRILFILAGNDDIHKSLGEFEIQPAPTTGSMATDMVIMGKTKLPLFHSCFSSKAILFILAGNNDMHESSEEFEIRPDSTTDCGIRCP